MAYPRPLERVFDYFGAHQGADRQEHEIDRARQRFLFPVVFLPLGFVLGHWMGLTERSFFTWFSLPFLLYGLAGLIFWEYLKSHPHGGVLLQYVFLVMDPALALFAMIYEPQTFSWFAVILLVIVTRVGIRYGMRTMVLSWSSAVVTALGVTAATQTGTGTWQQARDTYLLIAATLLVGVPLFIPVIRLQARNRELELQRVKIGMLSEQLSKRSQFLSRVSHELRTPLQALLSIVDLVELRANKPLDKTLLQRMKRSAAGLSAQLSDLLTLARGEAGSLTITPQRIEMLELFYELTVRWKSAAAAKDLDLVLEAPEEWPIVVVDGVRVLQIAENLVSNAVKYTEAGSVKITLWPYEADRSEVRFAVSDTGIGIEQKDADRIFKTYERAAIGDHASEFDSAGVGLSVVQVVLGYLGGEIEVQSEPGKGSTFSVRIPVTKVDEQGEDRAMRGEGSSGKRVMIVDDHDEILVGIAGVLREMGFETDMASSIGVASNLLRAHVYDTVFFDLQMPVKSGAELAADLRRMDGPNKEARFIAMTASDEELDEKRWPFNDFVRKPVTARQLKQVLGSSNSAQALS